MKRAILILVLALGDFVAPAAAQTLSVADFDACADGTTLCTRPIQAAIDSAAARYSALGTPQVVAVPAGTYLVGSLYLKSGVTLHLEEGALLLGSTNPFDYVKDPDIRWTAMLFAVRQHHIGLTGKGTIDGRGWEVAQQVMENIHKGLVKDPLRYDRPDGSNRPELIHFLGCDQVEVSGITLKDPASWCQQYELCSHLLIDGIRVDAKCFWNNDGLDIVDCREVVVRNCYIDASDDAYCFKSHHTDGVSENVLVENCVGRSSANGIKFGTATRGTFRHFVFRNNEIRDTYRSAITIASVDGASVQDIVVDGLRCIHTGNPFFLRFSPRNSGTVGPALRDIVIRNLYAEVPFDKPDAGYRYEGPVEDQPRNISPSSIMGCPGMRIKNVLLENIEITYPGKADTAYAYCDTSPDALAAIPEWERRYPEFSMWKELPAWGLFVRHADSVTLRNVTLRVADCDYRPALVADDVEGLLIEKSHFDHSEPYRECQVVANNCRGLKIRQSDTKAASRKSAASRGTSDIAATASDVILAHDNTTPCSQGATLYRASLYGCKSNGSTVNTGSLQAALDRIGTQGGGTLVFEVGRYLTGSVTIPPNVNIQLNEGAILVGSDNPFDYPPAPDGRRALLLASDGASPKVCGLGRIETHAALPAALPGTVELLIVPTTAPAK